MRFLTLAILALTCSACQVAMKAEGGAQFELIPVEVIEVTV